MDKTKRTIQKEATRKKIIDIAANQFALRGFSVPTIDIAKEAGLSHGSIFVHFPSKEDLVDLVIQQFFESLNQQVHLAAKGQTNMKDILNKHLDVLYVNEQFYKSLVVDMALLPANTQDKLFGYQSTLSFHFQSAIEKEQRQGKVKNISQHMLFNMWMGTIHYYLINSRMFAPEGSVIERYRSEWIDNYIQLIERTD